MNYIILSINLESNKSNGEKRREGKALHSPNERLSLSIVNSIRLPHESPLLLALPHSKNGV